jgi:hypothetical protein
VAGGRAGRPRHEPAPRAGRGAGRLDRVGRGHHRRDQGDAVRQERRSSPSRSSPRSARGSRPGRSTRRSRLCATSRGGSARAAASATPRAEATPATWTCGRPRRTR